MTLEDARKDLFSYVDAEEDAEKEEYFYTALNKAIDYVHSNFPERYVSRYVVEGAKLTNLISTQSGKTFSQNAKSYYFEVMGVGNFTITTGGNAITQSFDVSEYTAFKGFLQGDSKIEFFGEHKFYIRSIAMYGETLSDRIEDIPSFSYSSEYDFKTLTDGEFCAFIPEKFQQGTDGQWQVLTEFEVLPNEDGHILLLPQSDLQRIIFYKRHFKRVSSDMLTTDEIDVPQDLYDAFIEQFYSEYLIDENETSVDRAGYNYRTKVSLKQAVLSGENKVEEFKYERF